MCVEERCKAKKQIAAPSQVLQLKTKTLQASTGMYEDVRGGRNVEKGAGTLCVER